MFWDGTVLNSPQAASLALATLYARGGEKSSDRMTAMFLFELAGAVQTVETGYSLLGPMSANTQTLLAAIQAVADTEQGIAFQAPDGTLRFY